MYLPEVRLLFKGGYYLRAATNNDFTVFAPIIGRPLCTIIDQRPIRFTSLCHLMKYMTEESLFHRVLQVQKGDCADASKCKICNNIYKNT